MLMLINTIKQEIMTSNGQENAIKIVGDFIERRKDTNDVLTLTGPAGSGKKYLLKEIIRRSTIRSLQYLLLHIKLNCY
jgi:tRNA A37 threonylcarbamoyladenosine biosynthesis protein TsaE